MPKDTFLNLPEEKRALIVNVALDEFAEYSYDQASINRIVANSGIAKGSFYQYFEDKKDLFLFLMGMIAEEKIRYLSPIISNTDEHDIFTLVRELFISALQFASGHPRYEAISMKLHANKEAKIYKDLMADLQPSGLGIYESLLKNAIAKGDVKEDIDIKMVAFVISSMSVAIVEYASEFHLQSMYQSIIEMVDAFMGILKDGIGEDKQKTER